VRAATRRDAATHSIVLLLAAVLLLLGSPVAAHPDRAELSRVQRKLDAVRRVLADTRADADRVAAALVQADRDVTQARAALRVATANYRAAQATRANAVLEAARAQLEVDAQQAVIDRRARATYINNAPSAMLTLLVDADGIGDLLDRSKLLGNIAKAANNELAALIDAEIEAEAARQRAMAAEQNARQQQAHMRERAAELAQVRAARAAAKRMLERKVARLQIRHGALRASSARIIRTIRAEEAARRRAAAAARRAANRGHPIGPTVLADEGGGIGGGPDTDSYQRLTPTAKRLYGLVVRIFDVHAIGGWRPSGSVPGSDHPHGRAIDVMVAYPSSDGRALGWRIATWAAGNAWALDVSYVIFNGRIWTPGRGWHGYRHPSDPCNCNPTLRHDDHVHISVRT
jgi:peptidoglycan hydrolase CwlO-like protein